MKKILCLILLLSILIYPIGTTLAETSNNEKDIYDSYLTLLNPYAYNAITKKYGIETQYDLFDSKIVSIERITKGKTEEEKKANEGLFIFQTKVKYKTFIGAHNPPNHQFILTFEITPNKVSVINFIETE